ncbi:MAG TPA: amino acid adenylation domain-containing protein [Flavisolibacter sp.]|jgi:amino acid adenylation domain-containing protein
MQLPDNSAFFDLSPAQKRVWLVSQTAESSVAYNIPCCYIIEGKLDAEAFHAAFFEVIERHESLRSIFSIRGNDVMQQTRSLQKEAVDFTMGDLRGNEDAPARIAKETDALALQPFDLENDVLIRARLFRTADESHLFAVVMHHIAADGYSYGILMSDLFHFYSGNSLPPLTRSFRASIEAQNEFLNSEAIRKQEDFWLRMFTTTPEALELPLDFPRPGIQTFEADNIYITCSAEETGRIRQLVRSERTTLFIFLLSVLKLFLHKASRQNDIVVGVPFSARNPGDNEHVGMFVNTLPIRSEVRADLPFKEYLKTLTSIVFEAYDHQDYPFEKLFEQLKLKRDLSRNPLFDVMFVLHEKDKPVHVPGLSISGQEYDSKACPFDMLVEVSDEGEELLFRLQYATGLFRAATIERFARHLQQLLHAILEDPRIRILDIDLVSKAERHQLLCEFNDTRADYPRNKTVIDLFEDQAERTPGHIAVVSGEQQLTYCQLDNRANQLAHYLIRRSAGKGKYIPVCLERSPEMIVAVLGILKAGCAYVPVDPEYPRERIAYMLNDIGAGILVGSHSIPQLAGLDMDIIDPVADGPAISREPETKPGSLCSPSSLAYVIYTSGSTGRPKGVEMEHGALVNMLTWQEKSFANKQRRVLQFASLGFDVSFQEIFSTLCSGSSLCLIDAERRKDMPELMAHVKEHGITHLFLPYIVLKSLAEYTMLNPAYSLDVEELIIAGEQMKLSEEIRYLLRASRCTLINHYGPTEAHVVSSYTVTEDSGFLPPIGKPIDNIRLHVLDEHNRLCPVGIPGELHIAGVQLARGYLNQPERTAEKFVSISLDGEPWERCYKTGDLCRWRDDGNLEYLGRVDDQLKIRGFRIEPGEIENVLRQSGLVNDAVVVANKDAGEIKLVAYFTSTESVSTLQLRKQIGKMLPGYYMPAFFVRLEEIPLNASGKVNRKLLQSLPLAAPSGNWFTPPATEWEIKLAAVWKEVLSIDKVSTTDDFFSLGGSSILLIRTMALIQSRLGVKLTMRDFMNQSLAHVAAMCGRKGEKFEV